MSYGEVSKFDKSIAYDDFVSCRRHQRRRNAMANIFEGVDANLVQELLYQRRQSIGGGGEVAENEEDSDTDDDELNSDDSFLESGKASNFINDICNNNNIDDSDIQNISTTIEDIEMKEESNDMNCSNNALVRCTAVVCSDDAVKDVFGEMSVTPLMDDTDTLVDGDILFMDSQSMTSFHCDFSDDESVKFDHDRIAELNDVLIDAQFIHDIHDAQVPCAENYQDFCSESKDRTIYADSPFKTSRRENLRCRRNAIAGVLDFLTESDLRHLQHVYTTRFLVPV